MKLDPELWPWDEDEQREADRRERRVQRRMRVCVHTVGTVDYSGSGPEFDRNHICKAGVDWREHRVHHTDAPAPAMWPPASPNPWDVQPLMLRHSVPCADTLNTGCATCPSRQTRDREAAVAYEREEHQRVMASPHRQR